MQIKEELPVVIAGAGPCGLVAALTLEKAGVPFIIYEKTTPAKLCSNAGSGIDMAPTATKIFDDYLGLADVNWMKPYEYMHLSDMKGNKIQLVNLKKLTLKNVAENRSFGFANRSTLQHILLDALKLKNENGSIKGDDNRLQCSKSVVGYQNITRKDDNGNFVRVELSDGTTVDASALLACDGIHSQVRKCMYQDIDDPLNYIGQECWWGKKTVEPGSELDKELQRIIASEGIDLANSNMSLIVIGTRKRPGCFFSCETADREHAWGFVSESKTPPTSNATNDLTRRGGSTLTEDEKRKEIEEVVADRNKIVKLIMTQTPAAEITRAGFFDRKNLSLKYVDGRVALLGDSAHAQSPMMGQGANMAICDGYVAATNISAAMKKGGDNANSIEQALLDYDRNDRRKQNNIVIKKARKYGKMTVSNNRMYIWATKTMFKYMPASMLVSEMISGDKSNRQFVHSMSKD